MTERDACAHLKQRFEAAGYAIAENFAFDEDGVTFSMDGFDADKRVGYEFVSEEAGDGWDVDDSVKATLAERMDDGDLFVLVIDEGEVADQAALDVKIDGFLAALKPKAKKPAAKKPAARKPAKKTPAKKAKRR
jgi:hypothetical protein